MLRVRRAGPFQRGLAFDVHAFEAVSEEGLEVEVGHLLERGPADVPLLRGNGPGRNDRGPLEKNQAGCDPVLAFGHAMGYKILVAGAGSGAIALSDQSHDDATARLRA